VIAVAKRTTAAARITAMTRRTRQHVGTVAGTEQGRAGCIEHRGLFERVEFDAPRDYRARVQAGQICNRCPLKGTCGFRIIPSGQRKRSERSGT
jgi:hypothetical protein